LLEIVFLGLSAFRLRGKEVTVVTDPFGPELGLNMGKPQADIVTVSHKSPHHSHIQGVAGDPRVGSGPGEYEIADILIAGIATETEPKKGTINTAYVFRIDELTVCHLGDLGHVLSAQQVDEIGNIDILLVPAGGPGALSVAQAAEVISQLEPSMVIPMNYDTGQGERGDSLEKFCHEMGVKEFTPQARVSVSKGSLPGETQVVILGARSEGR